MPVSRDVTAAYNNFIQMMHGITVPSDPTLLAMYNEAKASAYDALIENTAVLQYVRAAQTVKFHEREIQSAREIQKIARQDPEIDRRIQEVEREQALKNPPATGV